MKKWIWNENESVSAHGHRTDESSRGLNEQDTLKQFYNRNKSEILTVKPMGNNQSDLLMFVARLFGG